MEVFLPHESAPASVAMASAVRGTVLLSSLRGLQTRGLYARYLEVLPKEHHDAVLSLTAASWQPIELAIAHYRACEALSLDRLTIEQIGRESGLFVNSTVLGAVARVSRSAGVTPWLPLENSHKLRSRTWVGSSIAVYKIGPKEACFEWIQLPVAQFAYMRIAFGGFAAAIGGLFSNMMIVKDMQPDSRSTRLRYKMSWA